MPLVKSLNPDHDEETKALAEFFNKTLGFCPNSVLTMQYRPAISKAFINLNKAVMANEGRVTSALKRIIAWVSSATGATTAKYMPYEQRNVMMRNRRNWTIFGDTWMEKRKTYLIVIFAKTGI